MMYNLHTVKLTDLKDTIAPMILVNLQSCAIVTMIIVEPSLDVSQTVTGLSRGKLHLQRPLHLPRRLHLQRRGTAGHYAIAPTVKTQDCHKLAGTNTSANSSKFH